jgi:hypothetical protein
VTAGIFQEQGKISLDFPGGEGKDTPIIIRRRQKSLQDPPKKKHSQIPRGKNFRGSGKIEGITLARFTTLFTGSQTLGHG